MNLQDIKNKILNFSHNTKSITSKRSINDLMKQYRMDFTRTNDSLILSNGNMEYIITMKENKFNLNIHTDAYKNEIKFIPSLELLVEAIYIDLFKYHHYYDEFF